MAFCRHCGNIVAGARCSTCGGTAVAPVVSFKRSGAVGIQDSWSKTYVSSESPTLPALNKPAVESNIMKLSDLKRAPSVATTPITPTAAPRRFPRPKLLQAAAPVPLNSGVSDHITHATTLTTSRRPPSPLKLSTTLSDTENDILPSFLPHEPSLSKVYGSVLQPKDTLTLHSCAICALVFSPDATIYPNTSSNQSGKQSFLCKPCFTENGGSKGTCPACSRPVLALKSEGAYIQSGGGYWHKQCYNCAGCFKNIGDAPMVDLLGRPSCVDCFDNCLKRDHPTTPKKNRTPSNNNSPSFSNPGGLNTSYGPGRPSRESSPALEELEQRLGLSRSREGSPQVLGPGRSLSPKKLNGSTSSSPLRRHSVTPSPSKAGPQYRASDISYRTNTENPIIRNHVSETLNSTAHTASSSRASQTLKRDDFFSPSQSPNHISPRPFSSSPSENSLSTMAASPKSINKATDLSNATGIASTQLDTVTNLSFCDKCGKAILNARDSGQFVIIPGADENTVPQVYHSECFRCGICDKSFNDSRKGPASFIVSNRGPCHIQCIPSEPVAVQKPGPISLNRLPEWAPTIPQDLPSWTSKKFNTSMPPPALTDKSGLPLSLRSTSPSKTAFPRFGGQTSCPGCHKAVSLMERGVVPGPQGSKWHASCLVCGGKKETPRTVLLGRVRDDTKKSELGCGKKLDSAAKIDGEGGVWCRECLLFVGVGGSPQASPTKSPVTSSICLPGKINPQATGSTVLARQFTGIGAHDPILRQHTGGGLAPTRSISPTKQLGLMGIGGLRPRPKSTIGSVRHAKSVDEGRGMYLVRQMTGTTSGGMGWGER